MDVLADSETGRQLNRITHAMFLRRRNLGGTGLQTFSTSSLRRISLKGLNSDPGDLARAAREAELERTEPVQDTAGARFRANLYGVSESAVSDYMCPKTIKYYPPERRMLTFEGKVVIETDGSSIQLFPPWPPAMPIKPASLVEAGFYYTGTNLSFFPRFPWAGIQSTFFAQDGRTRSGATTVRWGSADG
jgi:hypothetical protein